MILTLLIAFYTAIGFSQVLFESFENTTGPDPAPSTNWTLGSGNWAVFDTNVGGTVNWSINPNSYAGTKCAFMNRQNIGMGVTTEEYLATPLFTVPANGELSFHSRSFTAGGQGTIYQIKIATASATQNNPADYTTLLAEFNEDQISTIFNVYEEKTIALTGYEGTQVYIAFVKKYTQPTAAITGDRWLLDNVMIQSHPTCLKPIDLVSTNSTPTSVTLDWTETNGSSEWEIFAIPTGSAVITPASTGGIVTNVHPYTVTNLDPYTNYSFYVRSVCSSSDKSNWSTALFLVTPALCSQPSSILISDVGLYSATFEWVENGAAINWEVVVLPCGTIPSNVTSGTITTSNPFTITNLASDSCYRVFIRASCGTNDLSFWEGSNTFHTLIAPAACGGNFVDEGGVSFNYLDNSNYTYTICPTGPGDVVTVTFTEFNLQPNNDGLYIYNGYDITSPMISSGLGSGNGLLNNPGAFWGNLNNSLPGPFTSTTPDGCLTFNFISDGFANYSGWRANVSCTPRNKIRLIAFLDENNNGTKDLNESNFDYGSFVSQENNSGTNVYLSSSNGYSDIIDYLGGTTTYDFSYEIHPEYQPYFSLGSISSYNDITSPFDSGLQTLYFPIQLIQNYSDLSIHINQSNTNAGFSNFLSISCRNNGLTSTDGTITFVKPVQISSYTTSPTNVTPTATGFTYSFTNLQPNEIINLYVLMSVPPIPIVAIGEPLISTVSVVGSTNEVNSLNNSFTNTQIIQASYDPNDKTESHGGTIEFDDFTENDYLYYTIRFENLGTSNAVNIKIEDVLDSKLDPTSVRMVSASHDYILSRQTNHLTWNFNNIQLPVSDYPNSTIGQGFIMFKVKPKAGYAIGDIIPNTAEIYFDSNPAIVTNTFNTEFLQALGATSFTSSNVFLYPNPANNTIQISLQNTVETFDRISIIDVLGKNILALKPSTSNQLTIDVNDLSKGIYFVEIITQNGFKQTKKLIKE